MYNFFLKKRFKNNLVSIKKKPNKLTSKTREGFITMIKTNIFFVWNSGYMAPEYAMQGIFSEKSYVFCFGVLLLEIIAGKGRNGGFYLSDDGRLSLLSYVNIL